MQSVKPAPMRWSTNRYDPTDDDSELFVDYVRHELLKAEFVRNHPGVDSTTYEAVVREFARQCGV